MVQVLLLLLLSGTMSVPSYPPRDPYEARRQEYADALLAMIGRDPSVYTVWIPLGLDSECVSFRYEPSEDAEAPADVPLEYHACAEFAELARRTDWPMFKWRSIEDRSLDYALRLYETAYLQYTADSEILMEGLKESQLKTRECQMRVHERARSRFRPDEWILAKIEESPTTYYVHMAPDESACKQTWATRHLPIYRVSKSVVEGVKPTDQIGAHPE